MLWAFGLVMAAVGLVSCEEDKQSVLPAFSGFRMNPAQWHAGDTVTVFAVQQVKGDGLYRATYEWAVACSDTTYTKTYKVVYDNDKSDPFIGFRLTKDVTGEAVISFSAQYDLSIAEAPVVSTASQTGEAGIVGRIKTTAAGQLYGMASGSYTVPRILPAAE